MRNTLDQAEKAIITEKAKAAWAKATDNQKHGIRFGMVDMQMLKDAGFDPYGKDPKNEQRAFTLALMDCATQNGGMRA